MIERYVANRGQRALLLTASLFFALIALASVIAVRKYRRLSLRLTASHDQILAQQQALQSANEELERLSETDGLTRLANRRQFDRVLARECANHQRTHAPLSVLMIDVDHFKQVNDHYGHAVGDDYLRAVARALERCVPRSTDLVARHGGEEFACVMPHTDSAPACEMAERIRAAVADLELPNAGADIPTLTLSIGISTLQGGEHGPRALVASADAQLYAAKHAGRNRICAVTLHSPE